MYVCIYTYVYIYIYIYIYVPNEFTAYLKLMIIDQNNTIFEHTFLLSLVAQTVKRLCTMWETWVRSLGREDSLEKEMATHSSTLA